MTDSLAGAGSLLLALKLAAINLGLSGDNAIGMALVAAGLPAAGRRLRVLAASALYVAAMGALTAFSTVILGLRPLRPLAALLLIGIGMRLMRGNRRPAGEDSKAPPTAGLAASVLSIFLTDLALSTENIIALGAAGEGHVAATVAGLSISAPIVIYGCSVIGALFARVPELFVVAAAILGVIAGNVAASTPGVALWVGAADSPWRHGVIPAAAMLLTLAGGWMLSRSRSAGGEPPATGIANS